MRRRQRCQRGLFGSTVRPEFRGFLPRRGFVMRLKFVLTAVFVNLVVWGGATRLAAQASAAGHAPETPPPAAYSGTWKSQGSVTPCVLPWGGIIPCPPPAATVAIRAGRLFDSQNGKMLT